MRIVRQIAAAAFLLFASATLAQTPGSAQTGSYLQLRLGMFMPQGSDLDGFKNGFALDGAYGYRFHPNLAGEIGIGYLSTKYSASVMGTSASATLSDIPVTASIKAIAPIGPVDIYGLVGLGFNRFSFEASISGFGSASESANAFGFHLGAGVAFPVSSAMSLGLDLRFMSAKPSFAGTSMKFEGMLASGALLYRF